jgi:hypothetical protein
MVLSVFMTGLPACVDDYLDVSSDSSLPYETIFSDPVLAEGAVFEIYERISNSFNGRLWPYKGLNTDTEMNTSSSKGGQVTDNAASVAVYNNHGTDGAFLGSATAIAFEAVERTNICIYGLRKYGNPQQGTKLGYLLGEALFMRAWIYNELVSWFGNIPARFEPLNDETLYIGRSDRDVIYKQLLKDLQDAAELMPWAGTTEQTATVVRPNKAAAKALRARIALAAGGYGYHTYSPVATPALSNDPELSIEKTYTIARDECWELIQNEGSGFMLEPDFGKIFKDNCKVVLTAGGEPLFELPFMYNNRGTWMTAAGVFHRGAGGSGNPKSGSDPYTSVAMGGAHCVVPTLFYDFERDDARRDLSVALFRWSDGKQELAKRTVTSGKLRAEWIDLSKGKLNSANNDGITPIIIRYADVLLMFAEAENQLSGPTGRAKAAFNRVRTRAYEGVSQMTYVEANSADKKTFLEAIQNERRLEFVGEAIRKADLIRWNLLKTNMDKTLDDIRDLNSASGNYADVPVYVFWKYKSADPNEREIVWYGFERGEVAPGTALGSTAVNYTLLNPWMETNGWKHWNPNGNEAPFTGISRWLYNVLSADAIDTYLYVNDPNTQQVCPLPQPIITASQGALSNADLGY